MVDVTKVDVSKTVESNLAARERGFVPIRVRKAKILRLIAGFNEALGADPDVVERLEANAERHELLYRRALQVEQER